MTAAGFAPKSTRRSASSYKQRVKGQNKKMNEFEKRGSFSLNGESDYSHRMKNENGEYDEFDDSKYEVMDEDGEEEFGFNGNEEYEEYDDSKYDAMDGDGDEEFSFNGNKNNTYYKKEGDVYFEVEENQLANTVV